MRISGLDRVIGLEAGPHGRSTDSEDCTMTARTSFRGSFTALVTPFAHGTLDEKPFRGLVDWPISQVTDGLLPVGATGDTPTPSPAHHNLSALCHLAHAPDCLHVI